MYDCHSQHGLAAIVAAASQAHERGESVVLATIIHTEGSSYRKAGARMLLHADGRVTGILGGGCFEGDLSERAQAVFAGAGAMIVRYDMRADEDILWGLGLGCNGAVDIFLQPLAGDEPSLVEMLSELNDHGGRLVTVVESDSPGHPPGTAWMVGSDQPKPAEDGLQQLTLDGHSCRVFCDPIAPPPHLLILGAGPDALPLASMAATLGWRVSVVDHRPGFARAERFPPATEVAVFEGQLDAAQLSADAAVVMSHHFETDSRYLKALTDSPMRYLGVLGPPARRQALLDHLSAANTALDQRLHGPVGLDLGGDLPEDIALSILAQIQAVLAGRPATPLSEVLK
jgi:xanthine/CO dehydrogenase XdhC/CoxF family maturation factor